MMATAGTARRRAGPAAPPPATPHRRGSLQQLPHPACTLGRRTARPSDGAVRVRDLVADAHPLFHAAAALARVAEAGVGEVEFPGGAPLYAERAGHWLTRWLSGGSNGRSTIPSELARGKRWNTQPSHGLTSAQGNSRCACLICRRRNALRTRRTCARTRASWVR